MAKISVLVPVFNVAPYLPKCMDSILSQTLADIEVLCGDGGSTDGSLEILREYEAKDSRVRVISKVGSGYGESMNECMNIATGEYVGIVESDDWILPSMYAKLFRVAKRFSTDVVISDFYHYYGDKKIIINILQHGHDYGRVIFPHKEHTAFGAVIATWSGIYRRKFLVENDIRYNETSGGSFQDIGFWCKALCFAESIYAVQHPFYMWRQNNPSSSIKQSEKAAERTYHEFDLLYSFLHDKTPNVTRDYADGLTWRRLASYLWVLERLTWEEGTKHLLRAASDFYTLKRNGEYSEALLSEAEKAIIKRISVCYGKTPEEITQLRLAWELDDSRQEVKRIEASKEYKVGQVIYAIPNVASKMLRTLREKGVKSLAYGLYNRYMRKRNENERCQ